MSENGNGAARVTKPDPKEKDAPQVMPGQRQVAGIRLAPRALQDAVNVLKKQPWEDVADFMPQLIQAQPIFMDELLEKPESE